MNIFNFVFFIFLSLNFNAFSEEIFAIKAKGIVDIENGTLMKGKFVYIKNNRIFSIKEKLDPNLKLINLENAYLLPGMFDCHAHLFLTLTKSDKNFANALVRELKLPAIFRINRAKEFLHEYLQEGFTSICDLGNSGYFLDSTLKSSVSKNKDSPNLFISGPALAAGNAQFLISAKRKEVESEYTIVDKNTNIDVLLNLYLKNNVDIIKIILDGISKNENFDEKKLVEIINHPKIKLFKKITFHATNQHAYELIKKYNLKNAEHLTIYSDEKIPLRYLTNTIIDIQILKKYHYYNPFLELIRKNLIQIALKNNIDLIFGPDYYFKSEGPNFNRAKEVKLCIYPLQDYGLSNTKILQSLTINPARSLNIGDHLGKIQVNFIADIIAVNENPLLDIHALDHVRMVMRAGKIITLK